MKYLIVTGAAGGMGRSAAVRLAEMGYTVFALDRRVMDGNISRVIPIVADVTDEGSVQAAFDEIKKHTDSLYGILHFAGIYMLDSLVEMGAEEFDRIFRVNLFGAFLINKIFLPMLEKGSRIVITTSELAPLHPLPFTGVYAVSKAALDRYAYSLRMELQLRGIFVSVLRAGAVDTGMLTVSTDALDRFCKKTELYACNSTRFKKIVDGVEAKKISTDRLADRAIGILEKKRPRFAYAINRNPLLRLFEILPDPMRFWVIRQILK